MRWLSEIRERLRALLGRRRMERELDEELRFHIEKETEKLVAAGVDPTEARRRALVRFGGVERFKERTRESWGVRRMEELWQDARYAVRQLVRYPGFSVLAGLTLALGIGGTAAIWSVVEGVLLRPLPYQNQDRIVVFWSRLNWRGAEFDLVRERARAFEELAAYGLDGASIRTEAGTDLTVSAAVSANAFDALGARPLLGRTFREGEDRPGSEETVVLSHALWQSRFGGDRGIVGRRVDVNGAPATVIGVMPPDFFFPVPDVRLWRPLDLDPDDGAYHGNGWLNLFGPLRPDADEATVAADLERITRVLGERFTYPEQWDKTRGAHLTPIREVVLGEMETHLLLLMAAVGTLLLLASVNVASLVLARMSDRRREVAVRSAMGAGRGRLARQLWTETTVLALVAGAAGAALAALFFDAVVAALPLQGPYGLDLEGGFASTLSLDWTVAAGALALAVAVGGLVGLAPIGRLRRARPARDLPTGRSDDAGAGGGRLQAAFVTAEVVLAVTLVAGAALLARSVSRLQAVELGLEPRGVLAVDLYVGDGDMDAGARARFFRRAARDAAVLPGVERAALVNRLPVRDPGWQGPVVLADRPELTGERAPNAYWRAVTPGYFEVLGIPVVRGRSFADADRVDGAPVAIVNRAFVERMWPDGGDPLGRQVRSLAAGGTDGRLATVVGVVEDARVVGLRGPVPPVIYRPYGQLLETNASVVLLFRTDRDPAALTPSVRRLIREADPAVAVARTTTMEQVVRFAMSESLRLRTLMAFFGGLALLLGVVGVYGVVSYSVRRRTRELGIRLALGARPGELAAGIVRHGMLPVTIGVAAGLGVALGASRFLSSVLYEVEPTDPWSFAGAAAALLLAGLAAAAVPAVRAARLDPVRSLRAE